MSQEGTREEKKKGGEKERGLHNRHTMQRRRKSAYAAPSSLRATTAKGKHTQRASFLDAWCHHRFTFSPSSSSSSSFFKKGLLRGNAQRWHNICTHTYFSISTSQLDLALLSPKQVSQQSFTPRQIFSQKRLRQRPHTYTHAQKEITRSVRNH